MEQEKKRHGCLTAWLAFMLFANSVTTLLYLLQGDTISASLPNASGWELPLLTVLTSLNVVWCIALFRWKKWGFWGFCVSVLIAAAINLIIGLGVGAVVGGFAGLAILYGVLHIGDANSKGWPQLD